MDYIEILLKEYGKLDIEEGVNIPLVFTIDDIKNFGSRKSSFSKTITLPGTKNNNHKLKSVFDIKEDGTFDMTIKHNCILLVNRHTIMNGYMKLNSIDKYRYNDGSELIYYNVNLYDEIKNLFNDLGEKRLSELDFSSGFTFQGVTFKRGDHTYDIPTIRARMASGETYLNVYDYPIINHGYNTINTWPVFSISLSQLYPVVYHRAIIDKIFSEAGWNYSSSYFSGSTYDGIFNKIVNIYNGGLLYTNVNLCEYWALGTTYSHGLFRYVDFEKISETYDGVLYSYYEIDNLFYYDNSGATSPSTGILINKSGTYNIKLYLDISSDNGGDCDYDVVYGYCCGRQSLYQIVKEDSEGTIEILDFITRDELSNSASTFATTYTSYNLILDEGDKILLRLLPGTSGRWDYPDCLEDNEDIVSNSIGIEAILQVDDENFVDYSGTTISLGSFLPDMTQADFLRSHIKLANLYLWQDKTDPNETKLYIEPRDDFYDTDLGAEIVNWTSKVDWNKRITIEDLTKDLKRELVFKYTDGSDLYSINYIDKYDENYGTKTVDINNAILTGENTTQVNWQSVMFYSIYSGYYIVVRTKDQDKFFDEIAASKPIMGLIYSANLAGVKNVNLGGGDNNALITLSKYAPHARTLAGREWDLNFETNNSLIGSNPLFDDQNSYNLFWENYIDNITNRASRRVTYYIKLDYRDIVNLNFRNTIQIDGQEYWLERIEYDPSKNESSKVVLLKKKVIE